MAQSQGTRTSKSGKTTVSLDFEPRNGIVMGLEAVNERAPANLHKYMENKSREVEQYMKTHHPWTNRTGRAERGLHTEVEDRPGEVKMALMHSDVVWPWYGIHLEWGMGERYAIIEPTMRTFGPRLLNDLNLSELYRFTGNPKK